MSIKFNSEAKLIWDKKYSQYRLVLQTKNNEILKKLDQAGKLKTGQKYRIQAVLVDELKKVGK